MKLFTVNNYLPLVKIFTLIELFTVSNNNLSLIELTTINNNCLHLIKLSTVNNIN